MSKITWAARINQGRLIIDSQDALTVACERLKDGDVTLTIQDTRQTRSGQQNRYYHGVVLSILSKETGYTSEEMHDAMRIKFLKKSVPRLPTLRSTTDLDTSEFEYYMKEIRQFASSELGIIIPEPNEDPNRFLQ